MSYFFFIYLFFILLGFVSSPIDTKMLVKTVWNELCVVLARREEVRQRSASKPMLIGKQLYTRIEFGKMNDKHGHCMA